MSLLKINTAEDAMVGVVTLGADGSLSTAIKLMDAGDLDSLVITDGGDAVGIITQRDIIRLVAQGIDLERTPVKDVMTSPLITIDHDATIESVIRLMEERKVHHIPIMRDGKLVGIIDSQRIRSLSLLDALSIFTISAHAHYTPYLYVKMTKVYDELTERLKDETDISRIVKIVSDELRRQELVDEITVEQEGDEITITVKDCMYCKTVHPFIETGKEMCVMGLLTSMVIQRAAGKKVSFVDFCDITETGSVTRIVAK
ncbi:MAG: CBS domain-containing protein [Candidatus Bathyarchaeia archaeon]